MWCERLRELTEIVSAHQIAGWMRTKMGEYMRMAAVDHDGRHLGVQLRCLLANSNEFLDAAKDSAFDCAGIIAALGFLPVHFWPVKPAIIRGVIRVFRKTVIVQATKLVAHID